MNEFLNTLALSDDQDAFARSLVESSRFPSMSAVLQQGLDLLWQEHADAQADRAALRALLAERAGGPFVTSGERLA
ncbi:MAG: type II toxin-antitoxin system ParD family antitoxin [Cyanobacteria bacterium]|nr:type II toxin-antitoxin system ParD family antitoxin [Cyanobacteriota bacterium]